MTAPLDTVAAGAGAPDGAPRPGGRLGRLRDLGGGVPLFTLGVLAGIQLLDQATQSAFSILIPNVRDAFHLSDAGILAVVAAGGAAALACTIPVAMLADRFSRVRILVVGAILSAGFAFGLGLADGTVLLCVMLCAMSMGQAVIFPTHNSLLADSYPVAARQRVYSVHRGGLSFGAIFGLLVGAGLADAFSWRTPFLVFAIPTMAVALLALRLKEPPRGRYEQEALATADGQGGLGSLAAEDPEPPPSFGEAWRLVWKITVLRRIFMALPFLAAAIIGFTSLASLQYQRTFHLDVVQRSFLVAPVQVFDLLGLAVGAVVGTRLAAKGIGKVFNLLAVSAIIASGLAVVFALAPDVPIAFFANAGIDAALAIVGPGVLAALSLAVPARARASGFSIGAIFVLPGLAIIPLVGVVGDAIGLRYGMLILTPVFLIGGLVVASAGRTIERDVTNVWTSLQARAGMADARRAGRLPLLAVRDLGVGYGGVAVLTHVDLDLDEGEIVAVLGTNGTGKSTLLRAIGGVVEADDGSVIFDGRDVTHAPPDEIARHSVAQMPGGDGVFPTLSVEENLRAAAWQSGGPGTAAERVQAALAARPVLAERRHSRAGDLSGGQQQLLALSMALIARPRLLIVDELSLGLAPIVVEELLSALRQLAASGTAVLLVEQSVNVALSVASRAYVLEGGTVAFSGGVDELAARPELLRSIYLRHAAEGLAGGPASGATAPGATAPGAPSVAAGQGVEPAIEVRQVSVSFGGISALHDVSLSARPHEVVGVIGPNGAGKTTLFDVISGFTRPQGGVVRLAGRDVSSQSASARARSGLGRSFQDSRLFSELTVRDTLSVALERFIDVKDPASAALRLPALVRTEAAVGERVDELIELFGLERFAARLVRELSTGSRRLVDLAAVVAHAPSVVLLDEPSSGIAQREIEAMGDLLRRVQARLGATLVVVEHDMAFISQLADRLVVLDRGAVLAEGLPGDVLERPEVIEAFLGTDARLRARSGAPGS